MGDLKTKINLEAGFIPDPVESFEELVCEERAVPSQPFSPLGDFRKLFEEGQRLALGLFKESLSYLPQMPREKLEASPQAEIAAARGSWEQQELHLLILQVLLEQAPEDPEALNLLKEQAKNYRDLLLKRLWSLMEWQDKSEGQGAVDRPCLTEGERRHLSQLFFKLKRPRIFDFTHRDPREHVEAYIQDVRKVLSLGMQYKAGAYDQSYLLDHYRQEWRALRKSYQALSSPSAGSELLYKKVEDSLGPSQGSQKFSEEVFSQLLVFYEKLKQRLPLELKIAEYQNNIEQAQQLDTAVIEYYRVARRLSWPLMGFWGAKKNPHETQGVDSRGLYRPFLKSYQEALALLDEGQVEQARQKLKGLYQEEKASKLGNHVRMGQIVKAFNDFDQLGRPLAAMPLLPYGGFLLGEGAAWFLVECGVGLERALRVASLVQLVALPGAMVGLEALGEEEKSSLELALSFVGMMLFFKLAPKGSPFESLKKAGQLAGSLKLLNLSEQAIVEMVEGSGDWQGVLEEQFSPAALAGDAAGLAILRFQGGKNFLAFASRVRGLLIKRAQAKAFARLVAPGNSHGIDLSYHPSTGFGDSRYVAGGRLAVLRDLHNLQKQVGPQNMLIKEEGQGIFWVALRGEGNRWQLLRLRPKELFTLPASQPATSTPPSALPGIYPHSGPAANGAPLNNPASPAVLPLPWVAGQDFVGPPAFLEHPAPTCEEPPLGMVLPIYGSGEGGSEIVSEGGLMIEDPRAFLAGAALTPRATNHSTNYIEALEAFLANPSGRAANHMALLAIYLDLANKKAIPSQLKLWALGQLEGAIEHSSNKNLWTAWEATVKKLPKEAKAQWLMANLPRLRAGLGRGSTEDKLLKAVLEKSLGFYEALSSQQRQEYLAVLKDLLASDNFSPEAMGSSLVRDLIKTFKEESNPAHRALIYDLLYLIEEKTERAHSGLIGQNLLALAATTKAAATEAELFALARLTLVIKWRNPTKDERVGLVLEVYPGLSPEHQEALRPLMAKRGIPLPAGEDLTEGASGRAKDSERAWKNCQEELEKLKTKPNQQKPFETIQGLIPKLSVEHRVEVAKKLIAFLIKANPRYFSIRLGIWLSLIKDLEPADRDPLIIAFVEKVPEQLLPSLLVRVLPMASEELLVSLAQTYLQPLFKKTNSTFNAKVDFYHAVVTQLGKILSQSTSPQVDKVLLETLLVIINNPKCRGASLVANIVLSQDSKALDPSMAIKILWGAYKKGVPPKDRRAVRQGIKQYFDRVELSERRSLLRQINEWEPTGQANERAYKNKLLDLLEKPD